MAKSTNKFFKFDMGTPFVHDKPYQILATMPMADGVNLNCRRVDIDLSSLQLVDEQWLRRAEERHPEIPDSKFSTIGYPDKVVEQNDCLSKWPKIKKTTLKPFDKSTTEPFTFKIRYEKIKPRYHNLFLGNYDLYMVNDSEKRHYLLYIKN